MSVQEIKIGDMLEFNGRENISQYHHTTGSYPMIAVSEKGKNMGGMEVFPGDLFIVVDEKEEHWIIYSQKHQLNSQWNKTALTSNKWFKKV